MSISRCVLLLAGVAAGVLIGESKANAHPRPKHPYHAGYHYIPPCSAYTAVRFPAPIMFGAPAYYFPQSYLPPGNAFAIPQTYPYYSPLGQAGYYYLSAYSYQNVYPW